MARRAEKTAWIMARWGQKLARFLVKWQQETESAKIRLLAARKGQLVCSFCYFMKDRSMGIAVIIDLSLSRPFLFIGFFNLSILSPSPDL